MCVLGMGLITFTIKIGRFGYKMLHRTLGLESCVLTRWNDNSISRSPLPQRFNYKTHSVHLYWPHTFYSHYCICQTWLQLGKIHKGKQKLPENRVTWVPEPYSIVNETKQMVWRKIVISNSKVTSLFFLIKNSKHSILQDGLNPYVGKHTCSMYNLNA
jgi:hypothetical protein